MNLLATTSLGIVAFVSTNLDDIFVLMMFFADNNFSPVHVIVGQYAGIALLVGIGLLGALAAMVIPPSWIGLMGLLPILIGLKKLYELYTRADSGDKSTAEIQQRWSLRFLAIAAITFSNGGDNIGVYIPLFASSSPPQIMVVLIVFAVMVALWCALAYIFIRRTALGDQMRRFGHILMPFVLIALGFYILAEAF